MKNISSLFLTAVTLTLPRVSFAAPITWPTLSNPATTMSTLQIFIYWLIEIMQLIGTPILACCLIYAGFQLVTAGGNEEQITKAKQWILWTLVGGVIILGAKVFADIAYGTAILF